MLGGSNLNADRASPRPRARSFGVKAFDLPPRRLELAASSLARAALMEWPSHAASTIGGHWLEIAPMPHDNVDADSIFLCLECMGDRFLREQVRDRNEEALCTYRGREGRCITLRDLSECIRKVLEDRFPITPSELQGLDHTLAKDDLWE